MKTYVKVLIGIGAWLMIGIIMVPPFVSGCSSRKDVINRQVVEEGILKSDDLVAVIEYRQTVQGYHVEVELLDCHFNDDYLVMATALINFRKDDGSGFTVFNDCYGDKSLTSTFLLEHKGEHFFIDYVSADDPYLASGSPFYFADMNFDGSKELVVVKWHGGPQFAHLYDVYTVEDYYADRITSPPFNHIEQYITSFIPDKKQIINEFSNIWDLERFTFERVDNMIESRFLPSESGFVLKSAEKKEFQPEERK